MDIAFAFDEGYAPHVPIAIESVLECHRDRDDLTFWLLTTDAVASTLERRLSGRAEVRLLCADEGYLRLAASARDPFKYISAGMYLRLLLPDLLPGNVSRFLYLDVDVLVYGDLSPLWALDLGADPLAAVRDAFTTTVSAKGGIPGAPAGISGDAPYFNSGVLLVNTPAWRTAGITGQCLRYLADERDRLRLPDQDALNLATYGRWRELDPMWNDMVTWWHDQEPEAVRRHDTRVMHFLGPRKPWLDTFAYGDYRERYLKLAARLPD